jgi:isoquinoline 1-oxidoreductase beta subunit
MKVSALDRGSFLRLTGALGAGLGIAFHLPASARAAAAAGADPAGPGNFVPNAWVRIAPDETVTIVVAKSEMGQGVATGLPTILADELDASMDRVRIEFAPADKSYEDPQYGDMITGGSTSISHLWMPLRQAGATARAMLVTAAAAQWAVDPSTCTTREGSVFHAPSQRSATYGSLAVAASTIVPPEKVPLKTPDQFTLIGKPRQRVDIPLKVNGTAKYGIDTRVPGMLFAAIQRSPVFGGKVKHFDAKKAKAVHGVVEVVQVSNGVAVVAKNTWAAFKGRDALEIAWDEGSNAHVSTASLFADAEHLGKSGKGERLALTKGDPETSDGTVMYATYRGPFLAHATMEPMNATADVREDSCVVWAPNQVQLRSQLLAAQITGLKPEQCTIHTTYLGGGFGRRLEADYVGEAVEVSKAIKKPVMVMWSREDDIKNEFYRPMSLNVVRGVVKGSEVVALSHQVVSASWLKRWWPAVFKDGIDPLDLLEVVDAPYDIPNLRVSYIEHAHGIPVGSWRAPDANWNGFVTESFIDELAHAAHRDPLAFRLSMMMSTPRAAAALSLAAEKAGWGRKKGPGIAQGLAVTTWAGSFGAIVADVSMEGKMPKVHRVVAVVDCGTVVNPDIVVQQAQGATNYGLSAALTGKISIAKGRVEQNNFYDYTVLHMADAPAIEVHVMPSTELPTGIGEICTPPIAPAVGNAIFALTGKRVRSLPFSDALA